jgi:hypothetical protein
MKINITKEKAKIHATLNSMLQSTRNATFVSDFLDTVKSSGSKK